MSAITTLSMKNDLEAIGALTFGLSARKMYRNDPLYAYHTIHCHSGDAPADAPGKQMQLVISNMELPISYAGNGSILVRLKRGSTLHRMLSNIEEKVRKAAPPGLSVAPLVKEPDNQEWDPSLKLKTEWTGIHSESTGALEQKCVLKRCLFSIGRLNHYQGRYHWGVVLKSCLISDTPSEPYNNETLMQENLDMLYED